MSKEAIVNVQRGSAHTVVLSNVACRLVNVSPLTVASLGGAIPHASYEFYSRVGTPDVRQGDLLVDTVSGETYRVSGIPEVQEMSFVKVLLERLLITTP